MRNNLGFTYIEMVVALIIITVLVCVSIYFIKPNLSWASKNTFIDQANNISKAAITKFTNDGMEDDDGYPDDIYKHDYYNDSYKGRVCYNLSSLRDKYIKKLDKNYQGSVEVCYGSDCTYKTKIWLSNDKFYVDGITDNVTKKTLSDHVFGINRCGL